MISEIIGGQHGTCDFCAPDTINVRFSCAPACAQRAKILGNLCASELHFVVICLFVHKVVHQDQPLCTAHHFLSMLDWSYRC